jgi:DNA-binding FrmR family transcriptional regulator
VAEPAKQLLDRLARVEGQVRGLRKMLEEDRTCEEILTQLLAARSGLESAGLLVLDRHMEECVLHDEEVRPESIEELRKALRLWSRHAPSL